MSKLQKVGHRFESTFHTEAGFPFPAVMMPLDEGSVAAYDFTEPRMILRVRYDSSIHTGLTIEDPTGRLYILADHDQATASDSYLYRTHRCYRANSYVKWERETETTDSVTGLPRGNGKTLQGMIHCLIETFGREDLDGAMKVREQTRRLVTAAPIEINDIVDDMVVKRLDKSLGVWLAEIE